MRFRVMTPTASDAASTISENAAAGAKASLLGLTTSALSASEAEWEEDSLDGRNHIGRSNGGIGSRNGRARVANAGFGDYTSVSSNVIVSTCTHQFCDFDDEGLAYQPRVAW